MPSKIDKEIKDTSFENLNTVLLELEKNRYHLVGSHTSFTEKTPALIELIKDLSR